MAGPTLLGRGITAEEAADETRQFYELSKYLLTAYEAPAKPLSCSIGKAIGRMRRGAPKPYDAATSPAQTAVDGMIQWLTPARPALSRRGRKSAATDVRVYGATEANRLEDSMAGKPGVANPCCLTPPSIWPRIPVTAFWTPPSDWRRRWIISPRICRPRRLSARIRTAFISANLAIRNTARTAGQASTKIDNALSVVDRKRFAVGSFWGGLLQRSREQRAAPPLVGKENDNNSAVTGWSNPTARPRWPGTATAVFAAADPQRATTRAIKAQMTEVSSDDFNRPDGKGAGPGLDAKFPLRSGKRTIRHHSAAIHVPDGHAIPWGSATLDLNNRAIVGHAMGVGALFRSHPAATERARGARLVNYSIPTNCALAAN